MSILTMNLLVFLLDKIGAKARFQISLALPYFGIAFGLMVVFSVGIGMKYELKMGMNEKDPSTNMVDKNFQILTKVKEVGKMVYTVTQQGYTGLIKARITIQEGAIVEVIILEQQESFYQKIETANYIETLIQRQELLDKVDTISGATTTSNALKKMLLNTLQDYQKDEINE